MRSGSPPSRRLAPTLLLLAAALAGVPGATSAEVTERAVAAPTTPAPRATDLAPIVAGTPLTEALLTLQASGLPLIFSSQVVRPELRVVAAPQQASPRAALDELLAPHGLRVVEGEGGSLVIVPAAAGAAGPPGLRGTVRPRHSPTPLAGVTVVVLDRRLQAVTDAGGRFTFPELGAGAYLLETSRAGYVVEQHAVEVPAAGAAPLVELVLQPAPLARDEIVVAASHVSLLRDEPSVPFALGRAEMDSLPQLGGDAFRALTLLPGTAGNDVSAQLHVRGGRRDEVLVLLDGQELYQPFHLRDFDDALALVPSSALDSLDLTTGAWAAAYGDRRGGVLEMSTAMPTRPLQLRASFGVVDAQLGASAAASESLSWLALARRGTVDLATGLFGREEDPRFADLLAKVERRSRPDRSLRGTLLLAEDVLDFTEDDGSEHTELASRATSGYGWLTHQAVLRDDLYVDSAASISRSDRDRRALETDDEKLLVLRDRRDLDVAGALQSWNVQATARQFLRGGLELRRFTSRYDYASERAFDTPLAALRTAPRGGRFDFAGEVRDDHVALHVADRVHLRDGLTVEAGARFDRHSLTGDRVLSPRASLAWSPAERTVVRLGWGVYAQTQRTYELMVEDADTTVYPSERSADWVAGLEHRFEPAGAVPLAAVRLELYRRDTRRARPRYDNLLEPFSPLPEGELDRYRFEPSGGRAEGLELSLRGRPAERFRWWLNYGWAVAEDVLDGRDVPRLIDQRHTLNVDGWTRLGRHWELNAAWRWHSGRPVTPITVTFADGEPVAHLGPLNSRRLPAYHRLDLRLSRQWRVAGGSLRAYADVQNAYDRHNVAGVDVEMDAATGALVVDEEPWPGLYASAGLAWEW